MAYETSSEQATAASLIILSICQRTTARGTTVLSAFVPLVHGRHVYFSQDVTT